VLTLPESHPIDPTTAWITCQLGAREHYSIPRALHQHQSLADLITDAWVPPDSPLGKLPLPALQSLQDRFHPDLAPATIHPANLPLLTFELRHRLHKTDLWQRTIARNHWFQNHALATLQAILPTAPSPPVVFAYSYAALTPLTYAKENGCLTLLGQIDPGPVEYDIVQTEHDRHPQLAPHWQPPPPHYWQTWLQECHLADYILVNSTWSQQALITAGIPADKLKIVPLAYQPPSNASSFDRTYPSKFSTNRPLRVLFLGQVILRKGLAALIEAAHQLRNEPIEFWVVGSLGITPPEPGPNLRWLGPMPRSQVAKYYQTADVFLFPTLSDGFGLTQLEAQAWKLPIIASQYCGEVVQPNINGILLSEVSAQAITATLMSCLAQPDHLQSLSSQSIPLTGFNLNRLYNQLTTIAEAKPR
jgi:glycosyltransferase involved in cell wall biosynthesis